MKKEIKEDGNGNDVLVLNGLTKHDWNDTLSGLRDQLSSVKMQIVVLEASIRQVEGELKKFD